MISCPICEREDVKEIPAGMVPGVPEDTLRITCPRCGKYDIDNLFHSFLIGLHQEATGYVDTDELLPRLHLVSGALRERSLAGGKPVLLTQDNALTFTVVAPVDVNDRIDRLLLNFASSSPYFGANIREYLGSLHRSLGYCQNDDEYSLMISTLANENLIELSSADEAYVTADGWSRVRELRQQFPSIDQAFVAMSFSSKLDYIYDDGVKPAVEDADYHPFRIDREEHAELIDDLMIVEIDRSRFIVADVTEHNQGVYFEAGYAMGLGRPVIWTCKEGEFKGKVHFDIEHRNHIIWKDVDDLRKRLTLRVKAVIGPPRPELKIR